MSQAENDMDTISSENISRRAVKNPERSAYLWSFFAPFLGMFVIYYCLTVWPLGRNSVLVLDLNAQYVYYFEQLRRIICDGDSLLYTFRRALGGEFMGMFAYYLSSPFSLLVALFPKENITEALYFILLLKTGFAGLSFSYLIKKSYSVKPLFRVMFSTMYALSSYAVVMQHNVMWMDNVIAFPLILIAVDSLIKEKKFKLYVATLVYSIMSNFYIGYMTCIFVFIWFFARYFMLSRGERNQLGEKAHFIRSLVRIGLWSIVAVAVSAVIILPTYYSLTFGKLEFTTPKYTPKQLFDFADLLTKAFFGSYDSVRPSGMPFYYCGTLALILSPLYFFSDKIPTRRKVGYAVVMLILIASFNFSILDIIWHGMQRPNWLNARFAYMFSGLMLCMACETFTHLGELGVKTFLSSAVAWCACLIVLAKIGYDNLPDFQCVWAGILVFVVISAVTPSYIRSLTNENARKTSSAVLCAVVFAECIGNGVVMLYSLGADVSYSKRSSYRQMIDTYTPAVNIIENTESGDNAFYRAEKLVHRKKNDNFALGLNGMSNSTSTLNAKAIALLEQFGYASMSHWSMYSGATAVTDALFDIKYVMADETDDKPVMSYIHDLYNKIGSTDGGGAIDVYENPYALSIAYSVNSDTLDFDLPAEDGKEKNYVDPFTYMNKLLSAMTGRSVKVWERVDLEASSDSGVDLIFATGHRGYEDNGELTPKLIYRLNIEEEKPVYVYFPSGYPRDAELKLNGKKLCNYFDGADFSIRELGVFEVGENVEVELYLKEDKLYIRSGCQYFWYFNEDEFISAIEELKDGVMDAHSDKDTKITGKISVPEGDGAVFTSIPYDDGWKVTVDGAEVQKKAVLNGTLIGFDITSGEHEIEFTYDPAPVKYGLMITFAGLSVFLFACMIDMRRKNRKNAEIPAESIEASDDETSGDFIAAADGESEAIGEEKTENEEREE